MRWLIDVDDVLAELATYWISLYNKDYNQNLRKEDIHDWNIGSYTIIGKKMYSYLDKPCLYENIQPVPHALEGINTIRNKTPDPEIIFCTMVTKGHAGQKYDWLKNNGFLTDKDYYFEGYNGGKFLFDVDILIDDNPNHIQEFQGDMAVLFNQPWNVDLQKTHSPTIANWKVFIDKVEELL